jgi:ArsR family transcriptional regulator
MNDTDLVRVLKALADPIRFRMVQEIAAAGELSCAQIGEHFEVTQPTISHHLKILTDAEILVRRTEGKQHFTSVNQPLLKQVVHLIPTRLAPTARPARRA